MDTCLLRVYIYVLPPVYTGASLPLRMKLSGI